MVLTFLIRLLGVGVTSTWLRPELGIVTGPAAKLLPWQQLHRCHFVSIMMYISGAKFEEHCSNISGDVLDS